MEKLQLEPDLVYPEYPIKIVDHKTRVTRNQNSDFYKVQWSNHSARVTPRYLSWLWDPPVISSLLLHTTTRGELRSSARATVAPFRQSPSSGHHTLIPRARTFPGTSSTFPNPQPGFSRPESPQPLPVIIGARLKLAPPSIRFSGHPPPEPTVGTDSW